MTASADSPTASDPVPVIGRPGFLLLVSGAEGTSETEVADILAPHSRSARSVQAARRSGFTSAKLDENGVEITLRPVDARFVVEAQFDDESTRDTAIAGIDQALAGLDVAWEFVPGIVHDVVPGDGEVTVAFFGTRRAELSREQYLSYWLNHHALIAQQMPNQPGYRQLHVAEPSGGADAPHRQLVRWDGIATLKYPSYDVLAATRATREVAVTALLDEQTFIDHSKSSMAFFDAFEL